MKKTILFALLALCGAMNSGLQAGEIIIKGNVEGIKKGRLYLLARTSEEKTDTLGHCDFKRGKFTMKAEADEPMATQLVLEGFSGGFMLFAEPGTTYRACLSEGDNYYIKGGTLNDSYVAHMKVSDSLRVSIDGLQQRYDAMRAARKLRSASLVNDTLRREQERLRTMTAEFLRANDNIIMAYTLYSNIVMRETGLAETRKLYGTMGEGAKDTQYGRMIEERIARMAKTEGGAPAPDFALPDTLGNMVTMSSVKGKVKIVDFWASWCGPCRLNNPALRKLYEEFHDKGLEIIGVSLDTNRAAWLKAIEKDGLQWINVSSLKGWKCDIVSLYSVKGIPALFVLDEDNNIIATGLKGEQLRAFVQERLK